MSFACSSFIIFVKPPLVISTTVSSKQCFYVEFSTFLILAINSVVNLWPCGCDLWDCESRTKVTELIECFATKLVNVVVTSCCNISQRCKIITYLRSLWLLPVVCRNFRLSPWFCVTDVKISALCIFSIWTVADVGLYKKAVLRQRTRTMSSCKCKFDTYRNLQRNRTVLPTLVPISILTFLYLPRLRFYINHQV